MKYILDLTDVDEESKEKWGYIKFLPNQLPCEDGVFERQWDLIESELDPDVIKKSKEWIKKNRPWASGSDEDLPLGFDKFPVRAKLIRVE